MSYDDYTFCRGWDCGVRFYDEGRLIDDNPFSVDDDRAVFFRMGYNNAASADGDLGYFNRISDEYYRYS